MQIPTILPELKLNPELESDLHDPLYSIAELFEEAKTQKQIGTILPELKLNPTQERDLQDRLDSIAELFEEAKTQNRNVTNILYGTMSSIFERLLRVIAENKLSPEIFDFALTRIGQAFPITKDNLGYWSKFGSSLIDAENNLAALIDIKSKKLIASLAKFETRPSDEELTQEVANFVTAQYNLVNTRIRKIFPPTVPLVETPNSSSPITLEQKIENNPNLRVISLNPKLGELLKSKKYFVSLSQDKDLPVLFKSIQEKISSFSTEQPESIPELIKLFDLLRKKIISHTEKLTENCDADDIGCCTSVLEQCLTYFKISQLTELNNIDSFAAFFSALSRYTDLKANHDPFLDSLLKDDSDRKYLDYEKHGTILLQRTDRFEKDFTIMLSIFCGPAVPAAVMKSIKDVDPNSKRGQAANTAIEKFLREDTFLRNIAQYMIDNNRSLENIKTVKPNVDKRPKSLRELQVNPRGKREANLPPLADRSEVEKINFNYELDLAKYTLTLREIELLSKATGINLKGMTPIANKLTAKSSMTYDKALALIDAKIAKRERDNNHKLLRILWPKNVDHLRAAYAYINHHKRQYLSLKNPDYNPQLEAKAGKQQLALKKWSMRFSKLAKNFWSFFDRSKYKAIKDLGVIAREKKATTKKLKQHAPIWKTFDPKKATSQQLLDLKSREVKTAEGSVWIAGTFFKPKALSDLPFCQKLDSVANYFFPNDNIIEDAKTLVLQIQNLEREAKDENNLQELSNVSLMDTTRAALYRVTDSLQKIDLAIAESVNVAQIEQKSKQLGWEAVMTVNRLNAKSAKQALTQSITPLLRCSAALEQLNATVCKILTTILDSCAVDGNYQQVLEKTLEEFSKVVDEPNLQSIKEWQPEFINFVKNRDTKNLLIKILKSLQPENNDEARSANVKIIQDHLEHLKENSEQLKKVKDVYNPDNMAELLKTAKQNERAVKYFSERPAAQNLRSR